MKRHRWLITTAVLLVAASAVLYGVHFLVFRDARHIFLYLLGDIAFVPIEVLLVVVVIERMLSAHQRRSLLQKLNMVIGTFFSELGVKLLGDMTDCVENRDEIREHLGGDVRRVYALLTAEWLHYCRHLQSAYPYIFSIIVRTHPLQESPDPTVR